MAQRFPRPVFLIAVALIAPAASATWYNHGTHEPDNALDDDSLMWSDPPEPDAVRVYFNAWTGSAYGAFGGATISPNVGAFRTANEAPTLEYHMAILGVWTDCNGDGYVGMAETALQEYPANVLLDDSVCPRVDGDMNVWTPGAHNYNGWVSEYVPVGGPNANDLADDANDSRIYRDPAAMVWGDFGRPDDSAAAGGTCALAPQPRGTYQSTGGFVNYVDCLTAAMERFNEAFEGRRLAGVEIPGLYDLGVPNTGLTFPNDDDARGTWIDRPTFGSEDTQYSAVTLADCSEPNIVRAGDVINGTGAPPAVRNAIPVGVHNLHVPTLDPQTGNTQNPTAPATLNRTQEDFLENCDTSDDDGHDFYGNNYVFYVGETDFLGVSIANKRAAQWNFQFSDTVRDPTIVSIGNGLVVTPGSPVFGGRAGFMVAPPPLAQTSWNSPSILLKLGPRLFRTDVNEGTAEINSPTTFTFYAHVGAATTARGFALPGGSGAYAGAQCGDNTSGIHNGWNCDGAEWYKNADGSPMPEPRPFARPGQVYEFRDIDCWDGRNSLGIALGLTAYGATPCQPPS